MITRRAAGAAIAAAAVAGLASGCLSSSSTGGSGNGAAASGAGKSTVEVMYAFSNEQETAFQKDVNTYAKSIGVTVKFTKAGSWDTEINARVSGGTPRRGPVPQPGLMCDLAKQDKLIPYDDATVATDKATLVNGFVDAGPARTARSTACRRPSASSRSCGTTRPPSRPPATPCRRRSTSSPR